MLKNIVNVLINQTRNYAFKSKLKIKWVKPVPLPCSNPAKSGELETQNELPDATPGYFFSKTEGIIDADENVKKLCSIGFNGKDSAKLILRWNMMRRVQRHEYDYTSREVNIANLTSRIRTLQDRIEKHPHDHLSMSICKALVDKRQKFLKDLRRWDYKRFEWILEKLNIRYKSIPEDTRRVTRRQSITKLTEIHCDTLKTTKLAEYKQKLLKERDELLKEYGIEPKDRKPYKPDWCPTDIASEFAQVKEIPDPSTKKEV